MKIDWIIKIVIESIDYLRRINQEEEIKKKEKSGGWGRFLYFTYRCITLENYFYRQGKVRDSPLHTLIIVKQYSLDVV